MLGIEGGSENGDVGGERAGISARWSVAGHERGCDASSLKRRIFGPVMGLPRVVGGDFGGRSGVVGSMSELFVVVGLGLRRISTTVLSSKTRFRANSYCWGERVIPMYLFTVMCGASFPREPVRRRVWSPHPNPRSRMSTVLGSDGGGVILSFFRDPSTSLQLELRLRGSSPACSRQYNRRCSHASGKESVS